MVNAHLQGAWQASCVVMSYDKRLSNKFVLLKTQDLFCVVLIESMFQALQFNVAVLKYCSNVLFTSI